MDLKIPGYCYRVNKDVEISLVKEKVQDDLTGEEVIKKEILCNECEECGMAPESCPIVMETINHFRNEK